MGRVALGAAKKAKTGSVRVTEIEYDLFQKNFGGLGRFLQMQVNDQLAKWRDEEAEKK